MPSLVMMIVSPGGRGRTELAQSSLTRPHGEERTRVDILPVSKAERVAHDTLARHEVVPASLNLLALPASPSQGPDAVRVPETDDTKASNHARARVSARRRLHHLAHRPEDVVGVDAELARLLERVGEEVEEELRVGRRVDMTVCVVVEVVVEVRSVGEVAVLRARAVN